jgi:hypothetical protein
MGIMWSVDKFFFFWGGVLKKVTALNKCVTSIYSWQLIEVFTDTEVVGFW